jgi:hypothetical protein
VSTPTHLFPRGTKHVNLIGGKDWATGQNFVEIHLEIELLNDASLQTFAQELGKDTVAATKGNHSMPSVKAFLLGELRRARHDSTDNVALVNALQIP